jgi:hypothetical protein
MALLLSNSGCPWLQVYALTKERDMLRRESSRKSDTSTLLKEKDEIIKQVMAEGRSARYTFLRASGAISAPLFNLNSSFAKPTPEETHFSPQLQLTNLHFGSEIRNGRARSLGDSLVLIAHMQASEVRCRCNETLTD